VLIFSEPAVEPFFFVRKRVGPRDADLVEAELARFLLDLCGRVPQQEKDGTSPGGNASVGCGHG
jgi:hypothetical protein